MHAALVRLTIDPTLASAAAAAFTEEMLPRVTSAEVTALEECPSPGVTATRRRE